MSHRPFALFELQDLQESQRQSLQPYYEFLRVPALNVGLYVLPAGSIDYQTPHEEDEVYYVVDGLGVFTVEGADRTVQKGSSSAARVRARTTESDVTDQRSSSIASRRSTASSAWFSWNTHCSGGFSKCTFFRSLLPLSKITSCGSWYAGKANVSCCLDTVTW